MKKITARFASFCAETGKPIKKGQEMFYNYTTKKCYHLSSQTAINASQPDEAAGYVEAQENAYFDNFCEANNI